MGRPGRSREKRKGTGQASHLPEAPGPAPPSQDSLGVPTGTCPEGGAETQFTSLSVNQHV